MSSMVVNNRKIVSIILIFMLAFYSLVSSFIPTSANASHSMSGEIVELKVLHTNDLHARINDFGRISAYIEAEREKADHFLYLDAGDIFSGNPVVDLQNGAPIVDLLNDMGLNAMAIGNHDFDYGQAETVKRIAESNFPWLSANTIVGEIPVPFPQPEPYKIFDVNGLQVGVFSLTETPPSTAPANVAGMSFEDPIETAKEYAFLKDEVDVLIALTHIGYSEDRKLAEAVDFFDVIIGGHSHTTLTQPVVINGTPIVQAGGNANHIGNVTIHYHEENDRVIEVSGFLQQVSELTESQPEVQAKVDAYNAEMEELLAEVIGVTETGLNRSGSRDTSLGNFWTDAMRFLTEAEIALTNNGGIRDNIAAGEITVNDIYTVEPFANEIMKIEMTGAAIRDVIEYSYTRDGRNRIDLQSSGLTYNVITNNVGQYVDAELFVAGQPLKDDQTYLVAVGDYIGTGGSGYHFDGTVLEAKSGFMTEAMIKYARYLTETGQVINYSANERIAVEKTSDAPIVGAVIGSTEHGLSSVNNHKGDSGLGNLYADAVRSATNADFGVLNSSSVTGNIPAGEITDQQIQALDQFGNEITVVKTTVDRLKDVFLEQANYHNGVDLQVSGLYYELIKENNQFTAVHLMYSDGTTLDEAKEYVVAYNDYMHGRPFYNLGNEMVGNSYGKVWEAVVSYVEAQVGPIDYEEGSRIIITQDEFDEPIPSLPDGVISVADAIANNQGTATVQGYIIGTMTNNRPSYDGNFVATNLIIADHLDERDRTKVLPVQLPNTAIRAALNLVDNPDNYGKLVQVTGDLAAYFSQPGLRSTSEFDWVEIELPVEEPATEPITLAEARDAVDGTIVTVEAVVTTTPGAWGQKGFYIQDETAGMFVFQNSYDVKLGDVVRLTGTKGVYNQELQITNLSAVEVVGQAKLPEPEIITPDEVSAGNEGQLVVMEGITITDINEVNNYGTFEFIAIKDGKSVVVRVDNRTNLTYENFAFKEGDTVTVTGISSRFRDTLQVKPRGVEDIIEFVSEPDLIEVTFTDRNGTKVEALQRNLPVHVETVIKNNSVQWQGLKDYVVSIQLVDKHDRVHFSNVETKSFASGSEDVLMTELVIPPNHNGQRYTLSVKVYEGTNPALLDDNEPLVEKEIR